MAILTGAMTVTRLRVLEPELHDGWRELYRDRLDEHAFREPPQGIGREEVEGWCQVHNLLDTEFGDFNTWLYQDWAVFALRVDKKNLPSKLAKAMLDKRCQAWAEAQGLQRCSASKRSELKDELEDELLKRTLPTVRVTEVAWNLSAGWVIVHSLSESTVERVRKRFHRSFGKRLAPWSPLDWLDSSDAVDALMGKGASLVATGGEL